MWLAPQQLRFQPRSDGAQRILRYRLCVTPTPVGVNDHLDLEGNLVTQVWFEGATDQLEIDVCMEVETFRRDPFAFVLAPEALRLPIASARTDSGARGYLERVGPDGAVDDLVSGLRAETHRDSLRFLQRFNAFLFDGFERVVRHSGEPQHPGETLAKSRGACRDLAVLFIDGCRAVGIPARFASGYQEGSGRRERRHLHAWPEVYLPGAGWRGFDPSHGTAVADRHVTIAAAAHPADTMPVSGSFSASDGTTPVSGSLSASDGTTPVSGSLSASDGTTPVSGSFSASDGTTPVSGSLSASDATSVLEFELEIGVAEE